jgi:Spy/CpxP family protein refolding chaperone
MAMEGHEDEARQIFKKVQEIQMQIASSSFETMLAIRNLLTVQQRAFFVERMKLRNTIGMRTGGKRPH